MRFHLFVLALVPSTLVAALAPAQVNFLPPDKLKMYD